MLRTFKHATKTKDVVTSAGKTIKQVVETEVKALKVYNYSLVDDTVVIKNEDNTPTVDANGNAVTLARSSILGALPVAPFMLIQVNEDHYTPSELGKFEKLTDSL